MHPEQGEVDSFGIRSYQLSPWDGGGYGNNRFGCSCVGVACGPARSLSVAG